jgi:hypothetical protein
VQVRRLLRGLLVDPIDGAYLGAVAVEGGLIASVEREDEADPDVLVLPGFVDLQIYDWSRAHEQGVTGYLARAAPRHARPSSASSRSSRATRGASARTSRGRT